MMGFGRSKYKEVHLAQEVAAIATNWQPQVEDSS